MTKVPEVGVVFPREQDPATLVDCVRRAEALGLDQFWLVEDCFYNSGIAQAAIALAATERIKIGMGINPAVARNAAFLAMEYATLANAFPGRFIGGIGHGVADWMEQIGAKPKSWLGSIEETTTAVRRILAGESVTTDGQYVKLDGVQLYQPPRVVPPVLLGVRGEKSLRLAGVCADGVILADNATPEYIAWAQDLVKQGRVDADRDGNGQIVVFVTSLVSDTSPETARATMREHIATENANGVRPTILELPPYGAEMGRLFEQGGADALRDGMLDEWIDQMSVTGSIQDARTAVARIGNAGADAIVLSQPAQVSWGDWLDQLTWVNRG
jgi:alkanesulfonate monooxygenase SsuD/methylene tetrahydromethanopterin reductase-like flavin-dependent oxidoreductase (luciferase family)